MKKQSLTFLILFIISLLIFWLDKKGQLNFLKSGFAFINNPARHFLMVKKTELLKPQSPNPDSVFSCQDQNQELAVLRAELDLLRAENTSCQKLLQSPLPADWHFVMVHNLGVKNGVMTIDRGEKDGVMNGDPLLVENILVGRVSRVEPQNSLVELIFQKELGFGAKTLDSTAEGIVHYDQRLDEVFLAEVLNEKKLKTGEEVVTNAKEGLFPPGLAVGKVGQIERRESDIYQRAIIEPFFIAEDLSVLFVRI